MTKIGIICEYNPFHNGHAAQIRRIRAEFGEDCAVICLMSGNYVQRGEPAIFPKVIRAEAAILGGADLVLELPLTVALSSAEGFADGGVRILTALGCDALSFGTECGDPDLLMDTARLLLQPEIDERLRFHLQSGCSYPAARELALRDIPCEVTAVDAHISEDGGIVISEVQLNGNLLTGSICLKEWLGPDIRITEGGV